MLTLAGIGATRRVLHIPPSSNVDAGGERWFAKLSGELAGEGDESLKDSSSAESGMRNSSSLSLAGFPLVSSRLLLPPLSYVLTRAIPVNLQCSSEPSAASSSTTSGGVGRWIGARLEVFPFLHL